jgi:cation:H+ antiporter
MSIALQFCGGLVLLIIGAELLVRGSSRLAGSLGISPLVVGLTVVAFGTSAPELAISVNAALSGQAELALGNVIGSNIFNVLFILGISALIAPLLVSQQLVRLDVPLVIIAAAAVVILSLDQNLGRLDGTILFMGLIAYVIHLIRLGRRSRLPEGESGLPLATKKADGNGNWPRNLTLTGAGLILLVLGSRWLVGSSISLAQLLGVSELVIGLTIIAAGTSLPEVVTSIVATIRGEREIAIGNIVGSNLFNLLGVLGLTCIFAPEGIAISPAVIRFDLPVLLVVSFACLPIFFTGGRISRWEGGVLLTYYVAYTIYLFFAASHHDALPVFSNVMLYFVIPLTVITLGVLVLLAVRKDRPAPGA